MTRGGESGNDDAARAAKTTETTDDTGSEAEPTPPRRRRRRWLWISLGSLTALLLLTGTAVGLAYWRTDQALSSIERIPDALPTVPEASQPPRTEGDALVYLLAGVDDDQADGWQAGAARSDTMMLLQIPADRRSAWLVSLPRDTWTEIPGHGEAKLNAAYSWGGPSLMVETIQNLTGVRIDHLALIDWSGFREFTDAVGGVTIDGEHLDGREALAYVRERKSLPEGDLDRTRRQQNFLRSLLNETLSTGILTDPRRLNGLLNTVGDVISVDDRLSNGDLRSLAWDLRGIRGSDVHYMNAPVTGSAMIEGQSVVLLDDEAAAPLWEAIRTDSMPAFAASGAAPPELGPTVR
ncbi:LytR family transcriptional regulator [Streptomyces sp. 8K308]|uniref:LCP family protein n=1 Tax=Streptomyces sp. 8K308 TaxID=2530388 RepID=UPI00104E2834|nr:LCP family protein [Streptomyces sp. 8K308]TDC12663.1 LytR family transcriptional regulator [Streptomyces sp. 8K308]